MEKFVEFFFYFFWEFVHNIDIHLSVNFIRMLYVLNEVVKIAFISVASAAKIATIEYGRVAYV